ARLEIEAAYRLSRKPDLLWHFSLIAEKQGRVAEAIRRAEEFASTKGAAMTQGEREQIAGRLTRLRGLAAAPCASAATRTRPAEAQRSRPGAAIGLMAGGARLLIGRIGCRRASPDAW